VDELPTVDKPGFKRANPFPGNHQAVVMLNIAVPFVAGTAALGEHGAIYATRIPTTWFQVVKIPLMARVPVVLVARASGDYDPELHVVCKDPARLARGTLEASWHWSDDDDRPSE
jgi:hypothetical protein